MDPARRCSVALVGRDVLMGTCRPTSAPRRWRSGCPLHGPTRLRPDRGRPAPADRRRRPVGGTSSRPRPNSWPTTAYPGSWSDGRSTCSDKRGLVVSQRGIGTFVCEQRPRARRVLGDLYRLRASSSPFAAAARASGQSNPSGSTSHGGRQPVRPWPNGSASRPAQP